MPAFPEAVLSAEVSAPSKSISSASLADARPRIQRRADAAAARIESLLGPATAMRSFSAGWYTSKVSCRGHAGDQMWSTTDDGTIKCASRRPGAGTSTRTSRDRTCGRATAGRDGLADASSPPLTESLLRAYDREQARCSARGSRAEPEGIPRCTARGPRTSPCGRRVVGTETIRVENAFHRKPARLERGIHVFSLPDGARK